MSNTISDYFTDEDLEQNLRTMFEYDEMFDMDFKTVFTQIREEGEFFKLNLRGKCFQIDKVTGGVVEVSNV